MKYPVGLRTTTSIIRGVLFRSPVYVQVAITPGCNLRCRMCQVVNTWRGQPQLTLAEVTRIADNLVSLGVGYVVITGGEPFTRSDLPEVVKIFSTRGFDLRLQTNGTLTTPELADRLVESGLRHISVSLNSLSPEAEDSIAGREGTWGRIMNTLAIFSERLPAKANMIILNSVITPRNIAEIPSLAEFAAAAGFFNSFIPVHAGRVDEDLNYRSPSSEMLFPPRSHSEIDRVYSRLLDLKRKGYPIFGSRRFLRQSAEFLKTGRAGWSCPVPDLFFEVAPDGRYAPCSEFTTAYSVLDRDFHRKYRSPDFRREMRRYAKSCPGCMYACWPEVTFMCTSPAVFLERLGQMLRLMSFRRPRLSRSELIGLADRCRRGGTD